ncbi:expansin family protein [Boletus edulis]|nr:expansin family protein [Boletus edulis]
MYRPTTLTTLSVLFLSALATPMPFGDSLDKRDTYTGTGRPYYPQAGKGACGTNVDFSYPIVAVPNWAYDSGSTCNRGIIVTNIANENAAYARIGDECQQHECGNLDLDLSEKLFAQLDGTGADMKIKWYFVDW